MAQCPYCSAVVGKLYKQCKWCNVYFCEDCAEPQNHDCLAYNPSKQKPTPIAYGNVCSEEVYKRLDNTDQEECDESHLALTKQEMENHKIEGNLIYQRRVELLRAGMLKKYVCSHCLSELHRGNNKCKYCKIEFCSYCIEPEKHDCVIYQHKYGKFPEPELFTPRKIIKKKLELVFEPEPEVKQTPIEVVNLEPEVKQTPIEVVNPEPVKEIIQADSKMSLWQKFLSMLGFGKKRMV
jgi:predicted nucleic acid binding AN1-type Zn finger protein